MDFKEMGRRLGLEEDEFREITEILIKSAKTQIPLIKEACKKKDSENAADLAHSLKGGSGNLGFMDISNLAKTIEKDARNGTVDESEKIADILGEKITQIEKELEKK